MTAAPSQENFRKIASRWLAPSQSLHHFRIHTDTSNFFKVEYGDVEVDYFHTSTEKEKWLSQYKLKVDAMLEGYRQMLLHAGFEIEDNRTK